MAFRFQILRGSEATVSTYVGAIGQLVLNTDTFELSVHDGVTPGGHPAGLSREVIEGMLTDGLGALTVDSIGGLTEALAGKVDTDALTAIQETLGGKADQQAVTEALEGKVSLADLFENGIIKESVLPSYVDDVLEFDTRDAFPAEGEAGKIYVAIDTGAIFRWGGTVYVDLASPEILALASTEEAQALENADKAVSPARLGEVIAMLGFTQVGDDWVLDEGELGGV